MEDAELNDALGVHQLTFVAIRLEFRFDDVHLGTGTGFLYRFQRNLYLVTNWHNVTGRNPHTHKPLHAQAAIPNNMVVRVPAISGNRGWRRGDAMKFVWQLYDDEERLIPTYLHHPIHNEKVDVAVLEWRAEDFEGFDPHASEPLKNLAISNDPINKLEQIRVDAGMDAFVLGFPMGVESDGLAIWKRASVASEYAIDPGGLPYFFVDTATRQGMSGAPVYVQQVNLHMDAEGLSTEPTRRFVGVYSGRMLGEDALAAQLGIVWKEKAIREIIAGGQRGKSSFELCEKRSRDAGPPPEEPGS